MCLPPTRYSNLWGIGLKVDGTLTHPRTHGRPIRCIIPATCGGHACITLLCRPPLTKFSFWRRWSLSSIDPQRNSGLWHVCTGSKQHKAQKENGLVSGLQDHRYLSVTEHMTRRCQWAGHQQMQCSGDAAVRQGPSLSYDHRTCEFDRFLSSYQHYREC